ncbi:MAG TPA: CHASE2 domain-containing protein, partial [Verrucomicrobiae bacterium]|nr:CHASE2 domain-containing protein [Verrucomicrobiae bacterium]
MRSSSSPDARWRIATIGAILCATIGFLVCFLPMGHPLVLQSYDIPFAFQHAPARDEVVIVYLDEQSYDLLGPPRNFDRLHHARLLDHLTRDGAKLVVFDIWFDHPDPNRPTSDAALARAIHEHGKVVLLGDLAPGW